MVFVKFVFGRWVFVKSLILLILMVEMLRDNDLFMVIFILLLGRLIWGWIKIYIF